MTAAMYVYLDYAGSNGSPSTADITSANLRMRTDDANTQDATNPIPIVTGQTKYSYCRAICLKCITTPPTTKVDNVKFYGPGTSWGTGITLNYRTAVVARTGASTTNYKLATGTPGDTGTIMTDAGLYAGSLADSVALVVGAPLTVAITETSSQIDAATETTNWVILQMAVIDTATPGTLGTKTYTWQYDEI